MGLAVVDLDGGTGRRLSAWAAKEAGRWGTGGEASCENLRPVGDLGGGGVGARS